MKTAKECLEMINSKIELLQKEFIEFLEEKILERCNDGYNYYYVPFNDEFYFSTTKELYKKYHIISKDIREQYYKKHFEELGFKVLKNGVISWKEDELKINIDADKVINCPPQIISENSDRPVETKETIIGKINKIICRFC